MKHGHLDLQIKRIHLSTLQLVTPPNMGNSSERKEKVNESQKCTVLSRRSFYQSISFIIPLHSLSCPLLSSPILSSRILEFNSLAFLFISLLFIFLLYILSYNFDCFLFFSSLLSFLLLSSSLSPPSHSFFLLMLQFFPLLLS